METTCYQQAYLAKTWTARNMQHACYRNIITLVRNLIFGGRSDVPSVVLRGAHFTHQSYEERLFRNFAKNRQKSVFSRLPEQGSPPRALIPTPRGPPKRFPEVPDVASKSLKLRVLYLINCHYAKTYEFR